MRYGILSDIHGNLEALDAMLEVLGAAGVSSFLCLGDIVGYGADPNACCERIWRLPGLRVHGNHDLAALGAVDLERFNPHARQAAEWTARELAPENRRFLASLRTTAGGEGFRIVHGSLTDPAHGYITDPRDARACLDLLHEPVCFVGHTHVPLAFGRRRGSLFCGALPFRPTWPVALGPDREYVVNCGSVGQPRDWEPDAACGVFDTEERTVTLLRVPYDIGGAQSKIRRAGLPSLLADRLASGW